MGAEFKLTDAIDISIVEHLKQISTELTNLNDNVEETTKRYADLAKQLAGGIGIKPADIEGLQSKYAEYLKTLEKLKGVEGELSAMQQKYNQMQSAYRDEIEKLTAKVAELQKANEKAAKSEKEQADIRKVTTNTISRELAEIEKENAKKREEFQLNKQAVDVANQMLGSRRANIEALAEYQRELESIKASRKANNEALAEGAISEGEYAKNTADLLEQERALKVTISDVQQTLKIQEKLAQDAGGSYSELSHQLELMKRAYKQLNDEQKGGAEGQSLAAEIQKLDAHLKDLSADMGEHHRNVGNYAIANASLKQELRGLTEQIASATLEYRAMSDEEKASAQGQALRQKIEGLTNRASNLRDVVADVNREISTGASDTRKWDSLTQSMGLVAGGFAAATAAGKAFGLEEEELGKVQASAVGLVAAFNSVKEIQNKLQKEGAVVDGISRIQKIAENKAIALNTAAQSKNILVQKSAIVTQKALNLVAKANPYVLLATGIAAVVGGLIAWVSGSSKAKAAQAQLNAEIKATHDYMSQLDRDLDIEVRMAEATGATAEEVRKLRLEYAKLAETRAYEKYQEVLHNPESTKEQADEMLKTWQDAYHKVDAVIADSIIAEVKARNEKKKVTTSSAKDAADEAKRIAEEQAKYEEDIRKRLAASNIELIEDEQAKELAQLKAKHDEELATIKGNTEAEIELRANIEEKYARDVEAIEKKYADERLAIELELIEQRQEAIEKDFAYRAAMLNEQMAQENLAAKQRYAEGIISEQEYNAEVEAIKMRYATMTAKNSILMMETQLSEEKLTAEQRKELEQKLSEAKIALSDEETDAIIANTNKQAAAHAKALKGVSEILNLTSQMLGGLSDFGNQLYENQLNALDEQNDALDEAYDREIERIEKLADAGSISTEEAEARKRAALDRTAAEEERIEKKREELKKKQARMAKLTAIAEATIGIANSIINVWADKGNGNFISRGIMSGIVAALGATQLATIIATPISAYAKGTDDHKGGLAVVGDGGAHEIIQIGNKAYLTPATPTLVDLPAHAKVIPNVDTNNIYNMGSDLSMLMAQREAMGMPNVVVNSDFSDLEKRMENNTREIQLLRKILHRDFGSMSMSNYVASRM